MDMVVAAVATVERLTWSLVCVPKLAAFPDSPDVYHDGYPTAAPSLLFPDWSLQI
jgi:hypothetical protein